MIPVLSSAACIGRHDLFEPEFGLELVAKRLCLSCPVQDPCLLWALRSGEPGILGGLTERERRKLMADTRQSKFTRACAKNAAATGIIKRSATGFGPDDAPGTTPTRPEQHL